MKRLLHSYPVSAVPFVITVILLFVAVWNSSISRKDVITSVERLSTFEVQTRNLENLHFSLKEVESAQRGYMITGDDHFLGPYQSGLERIDELIILLDQSLDTNPFFTENWTDIKEDIQKRTRIIAATLEERKSKGFDAGLTALRDEHGREVMASLREELNRIIEHNDTIAQDARDGVQESLSNGALSLNLLAIAAVAAGIMGIVTLAGAVRARVENREMERDKERAEKADMEKSRFLANMSHEIRTPLNAMLGFGELLEEQVEGRRAKKYLTAIRTSGESLANLINDILDLSKVESGVLELEIEPVIIEDFARSLHLMFHQRAIEAGVDFKVEVAPSCPDFLEIDPLRVRQILTNLLGNAFKFTPTGSVAVKFEGKAIPGVENRVTFRASVADTGRGIPKSKLKAIFKPFKQVEVEDENKGGTGLGLSICRKLAHLMGGRVTVKSVEGEGSTFTLELKETPIAVRPEQPADDAPTDSHLAKFRPSKILVVDDNPFNRELVAGYFHGTGHEMAFAVNGKEGVEEAKRFKPDVILMDIRMPVMDGKEAYKLIRSEESTKDAAVLAVTASSLIKQERELRKKFDAYLRKPFSRSQLVAALENILPKNVSDKIPAFQQQGVETGNKSGVQPPPSDPEKWKALGKKLRELRDGELVTLKAEMALGEISTFGRELSDLAEEHDCDFLADYANSLKEHADHFELSAVEKQLGEFPGIIDRIGSTKDEN